MTRVREEVRTSMGPSQLVDAVGVSAMFHMMNRVANGTGTPLDPFMRETASLIAPSIGASAFLSMEDTPLEQCPAEPSSVKCYQYIGAIDYEPDSRNSSNRKIPHGRVRAGQSANLYRGSSHRTLHTCFLFAESWPLTRRYRYSACLIKTHRCRNRPDHRHRFRPLANPFRPTLSLDDLRYAVEGVVSVDAVCA